MDKQEFEELLKKIGWSLRFIDRNMFAVINHRGINTRWKLRGNELDYDAPNYLERDNDENFCVSFNIAETKFNIIEKGTICLYENEKKAPFVLFMNHSIKRDALVSKGDGQ